MSTYLVFNTAAAAQNIDLMKGDFRFAIVVPTDPTAGDSRKFGLYSSNKGSGIYFEISGTTFQAVAIDGVTGESTEESITWESSWTGTKRVFRIIWQAGMAHFYVDGTKKATIAFSDEDLDLASTPMRVYIKNDNADDMLVGYIECVGVQSYST